MIKDDEKIASYSKSLNIKNSMIKEIKKTLQNFSLTPYPHFAQGVANLLQEDPISKGHPWLLHYRLQLVHNQ